VLELAAWFHDAIYVARPDGESEEKSADLAERALAELEVDAGVRARVRAIILATKRHQPTGDPAGDLFLDADLSVLGADPDVFDAYERGVRAEWSWVPDAAFADGRATFVRGMLARPAIFLTERYRARLEARARKNLERSLVRLAAPGSTSG
jgi:predicted metal-dependent HD superfamily phosphohydrolase